MALSLVLKAAEVLEHFQWKSPEEMAEHVKNHKAEVGEELADTLYWVLLMAHDFEIDIVDIFEKKMSQNEAKYSRREIKRKSQKVQRTIGYSLKNPPLWCDHRRAYAPFRSSSSS